MQMCLTVIIDANVFWLDRSVRSANWFEFRNVHDHYTCTVRLPLVTAYELVGLRQQEVQKKASEVQDAAKRIERALKEINSNFETLGFQKCPEFGAVKFLSDLEISQPIFSESSLKAQIAALQIFLGSKIVPVPWPSMSHEAVVLRCSQIKAPFTYEHGKDKGYKDYLFWLSILEVLKETQEHVVVITNDSAFYGSDKKPHPDLLSDLLDIDRHDERLTFCKNLSEFIEQFITPFTFQDDAYISKMRQDRFKHLDEQIEILNSAFDEALHDSVHRLFPTDGEHRNQRILRIEGCTTSIVDIREARKHPASTWFVTASVICNFRVLKEVSKIYDGMFTLREEENSSFALECACDLHLGEDNNLQAATIDSDDVLVCDVAKCRLTVSIDSKGYYVQLHALVSFSESETSLQHWDSIETVRRCLKEFGVGEIWSPSGLEIEPKQIYEIEGVPLKIIEKWGYRVPDTRRGQPV